MELAGVVLSGYLLALAAPWLTRIAGGGAKWLLAAFPAGLTVHLASFVGAVSRGDTVRESAAWVPALGMRLAFRVDGLSLLFALLVTGIGTLVIVYAGGYLAGDARLGRLQALLLAFLASMLGLVLADDLLVLLVFWELTTVASFFLIGFDFERRRARTAAWQAITLTIAGGQALLAGLLLLIAAGGTTSLSTLLASGGAVRGHAHYGAIVMLVLIGAFVKSAQVPFHFWLPAAMEAPTPVSAYLHSATMVKAGVYLLARLNPVLGGTALWEYATTVAGATTMLVGAFLALAQTDLKRLLAYATVSVLGLLVLLIGLATTLAVQAAIAYLVVHALYKGALFLAIGAIERQAGTRNAERLRGLGRAMPVTALATGLAALSMAGLPPLLGFIGKEQVYEAKFEAEVAAPALTAAAVTAYALLVAVAVTVGVRPFLDRTPTPRGVREPPPSLRLGPLVLAGSGLLLGLSPGLIEQRLVAPAVAAVLGTAAEVELRLWEGWTPPVAFSVLSFLSGLGLYTRRRSLRRALIRLGARHWGPQRWYLWTVTGLAATARVQTRIIQHGRLSGYLRITLAGTVALVGAGLLRDTLRYTAGGTPRVHEVITVAVVLAAAAAAGLSRSRLGAATALGVTGLGVAILFALFGAPDLAMAQFLIETLSVVLFVLVLRRLPVIRERRATGVALLDAAVALGGGALMGSLVLLAARVDVYAPVSELYLETSVPAAHARNVVSAILADFRALDTLGEVVVVVVAGLGVHALLRSRAAGRDR